MVGDRHEGDIGLVGRYHPVELDEVGGRDDSDSVLGQESRPDQHGVEPAVVGSGVFTNWLTAPDVTQISSAAPRKLPISTSWP